MLLLLPCFPPQVQKLLVNAFDSSDHAPPHVHEALDILRGSLASAEADRDKPRAASQQKSSASSSSSSGNSANSSSSRQNGNGFSNGQKRGNGVGRSGNGKSTKKAPQMV